MYMSGCFYSYLGVINFKLCYCSSDGPTVISESGDENETLATNRKSGTSKKKQSHRRLEFDSDWLKSFAWLKWENGRFFHQNQYLHVY